MKIRILEAARLDLVNGYRFYEQREPGLGSYFLDSLYADIESLALYAGVHPPAIRDARRLLSRRFPYAVYYRLQGDLVTVVGVFHGRRSPGVVTRTIAKRAR